MSDLLDAFVPVARAFQDIGAPGPAICDALRLCADAMEEIERLRANLEAEAKRPRLVLVSNRED